MAYTRSETTSCSSEANERIGASCTGVGSDGESFNYLNSLKTAKVSHLLQFLDQRALDAMDCSRDASSLKLTHPNASMNGGTKIAATVTNNDESDSTSIQKVFLELKDKMDRLRFDKEVLFREKEGLLEQLAASLEREKKAVHTVSAEYEKELKSIKRRMREDSVVSSRTRKEYELERNQLIETVEMLRRQVSQEAAARKDEVDRMEAAHTSALNILKAKYLSHDRATREKWKQQESKRIKESTLQSLEPDIVLLLQRHKSEKARLEEQFSRSLQQREAEWSTKENDFLQQLAEMEQMQRRHEVLRNNQKKEYEESLQRVERENQMLQVFWKDQLRKSEEESCAARDTLISSHCEASSKWSQERSRLESCITSVTDQRDNERQAFEEKLRACAEKSRNDALLEEEKRRVSWTAAKESELRLLFATELQEKLQQAERRLTQQCEAERDTSIAAVIDSLQREHQQKLIQDRAEMTIKKEELQTCSRENEALRVELANCRQALERTEKETKVVLQTCREYEEKYQRLEAMRYAESEQRTAEMDLQRSLADAEWRSVLTATEASHTKKCIALENALSDADKNYALLQRDMEESRNRLIEKHHAEVNQIEDRVLQTLRLKDDKCNELRRRIEEMEQQSNERERWWKSQQALLLA